MRITQQLLSHVTHQGTTKEVLNHMTAKDKHDKIKKLNTNLGIALNGYRHRIKEEKQAINKAKVNIKRYKLLAKQARNTYKLELLEEL